MIARVPLSAAVILGMACGSGEGGSSARWMTFDAGSPPAELKRAEVLFNSYCLSCHGRQGRGEGLGPPLLDSLFLPSSIPDDAALQAIERGTTQRNFSFGAMPPVPRLSRGEAEQVVAYVRWLQRRAWPDRLPATSEPDP